LAAKTFTPPTIPPSINSLDPSRLCINPSHGFNFLSLSSAALFTSF